MDHPYLASITIVFPNDTVFASQLFPLLESLGIRQESCFEFTSSNPEFTPRLRLDFNSKAKDICVNFANSHGQHTSIKVENSTGIEKRSPHAYGYVSLADVASRLESAGLTFVGLDHLGFNLPWFSSDLHPQIAAFRSTYSSMCLYHCFPSGEAWDFILPGDRNEILGRKEIDYKITRKPKFELVSFEKTSKPLIQIDLSTHASYQELALLFPESLKDPQIGNVWLYLENRFTIDVCLVLNPFSEGDWSDFFKGCRL